MLLLTYPMRTFSCLLKLKWLMWLCILAEEDAFRVFLLSVFYIGKGRHSRPYEHFREALAFRHSMESNKVQQKLLNVKRRRSLFLMYHCLQFIYLALNIQHYLLFVQKTRLDLLISSSLAGVSELYLASSLEANWTNVVDEHGVSAFTTRVC